MVNALSKSLVANIKRDGFEYEQRYRQGTPITKVEELKAARGTGTRITFQPDEEIFGEVKFDAALIKERLQISAFLNKGLRIVFIDEQAGSEIGRMEMQYDGGVADFLTYELAERPMIGGAPFLFSSEASPRMDIALCWTNETSERIRSFVNGIPTNDGGTHEQGLKDALLKSIRGYIETHNVTLPRGVRLSADDIRVWVVAICSSFIADPQFQGQTKNRLNNPEVRSEMDAAIRPAMEIWLNSNASIADALITRMVMAARARMASRAATDQVRRKSAVNKRLNLLASSQTAPSAIPPTVSCSSLRGIRPVVQPNKAETVERRPSCRCVERFSTPSRLLSQRSLPTKSSPTSSRRWAVASARIFSPSACATTKWCC